MEVRRAADPPPRSLLLQKPQARLLKRVVERDPSSGQSQRHPRHTALPSSVYILSGLQLWIVGQCLALPRQKQELLPETGVTSRGDHATAGAREWGERLRPPCVPFPSSWLTSLRRVPSSHGAKLPHQTRTPSLSLRKEKVMSPTFELRTSGCAGRADGTSESE